MTNKDSLLIFKCFNCNKTYEKKFDEDLLKRYQNLQKLCHGDINKFCLIFQKSVYPYENIDG